MNKQFHAIMEEVRRQRDFLAERALQLSADLSAKTEEVNALRVENEKLTDALKGRVS